MLQGQTPRRGRLADPLLKQEPAVRVTHVPVCQGVPMCSPTRGGGHGAGPEAGLWRQRMELGKHSPGHRAALTGTWEQVLSCRGQRRGRSQVRSTAPKPPRCRPRIKPPRCRPRSNHPDAGPDQTTQMQAPIAGRQTSPQVAPAGVPARAPARLQLRGALSPGLGLGAGRGLARGLAAGRPREGLCHQPGRGWAQGAWAGPDSGAREGGPCPGWWAWGTCDGQWL